MNKLKGFNSSSNEARRLMALEMLRTPENSHFIDEARVSGASAEDTALKIVKSMVQSDDAATEIANFIKKMRGQQSTLINQTIRQSGPYSYMDDSFAIGSHDPADEIVAEIMRIRGSDSKSSRLPSNHLGTLSSLNSTLRKDERTMKTPNLSNAEAQRLKDLESIRTPENSHIIDEAIASGEPAEAAALRIVYARIEEKKMIDEMVAEANKIIARRNGII